MTRSIGGHGAAQWHAPGHAPVTGRASSTSLDADERSDELGTMDDWAGARGGEAVRGMLASMIARTFASRAPYFVRRRRGRARGTSKRDAFRHNLE